MRRASRRFEGSHYAMDNRVTIVTRVHCSDGIVGEAYNGDSDVDRLLEGLADFLG